MTVRAHLVWNGGGHAEVVRIDREAIELRSTVPSPPGARLEAILEGAGASVPVTVKSYGTKREADGAYALRGRLISASRELIDRLGALPAAELR